MVDVLGTLTKIELMAYENKCNCRPCQYLRKFREQKLEEELEGLRAALRLREIADEARGESTIEPSVI